MLARTPVNAGRAQPRVLEPAPVRPGVGSIARCACGGSCPRCARSPGLQGADARPKAFDQPRGDARAEGVRFSERKAVCMVPDSFRITMDEHRNDESSATGRLAFVFQAHGRTRHHGGVQQIFAVGPREQDLQGRICDCDCMTYRQHIRGIALRRDPGDARFQAETRIMSAHWTLPLDGQWHEENTSTIVGRSSRGCAHEYEDHPGVVRAGGNGTMWLARLNFLLQVWDLCTQRAVRESQQTLTVGGDEPPRSIKWDGGWLPLTRDDIRLSYAGIASRTTPQAMQRDALQAADGTSAFPASSVEFAPQQNVSEESSGEMCGPGVINGQVYMCCFSNAPIDDPCWEVRARVFDACFADSAKDTKAYEHCLGESNFACCRCLGEPYCKCGGLV